MVLNVKKFKNKTVLVTGSNGFLGRNLVTRLMANTSVDVLKLDRSTPSHILDTHISNCDIIIHLAGENRANNPKAFIEGNVDLTRRICQQIRKRKCGIPVFFSSSIKAEDNSDYGKSKGLAEIELKQLSCETESPVAIYRLPNIFGKWAKPNYNSVVATFCYNLANDLPIEIHDPEAAIELAYVDDVIEEVLKKINSDFQGFLLTTFEASHRITVGYLAQCLKRIHSSRGDKKLGDYSNTLYKQLYSTYLSYLPIAQAVKPVQFHSDARGLFLEFCKSASFGQISFLSIACGQKRGGHYHHTKVERFIVLKGTVEFQFVNTLDETRYKIVANGETPEVIETFPGWAHQLSNVGNEECYVAIWANEMFDEKKPDTYRLAF